MNEDMKIKYEHFANIVAVAYADSKLTKEEVDLLSIRAEEYGLPHEKVQELIDNAENLEFVIPMNSVEREEQLSEAVLMSMIDGEISPNEYKLCMKIAEKLGFNENYLNHIIELSQKLSDKK